MPTSDDILLQGLSDQLGHRRGQGRSGLNPGCRLRQAHLLPEHRDERVRSEPGQLMLNVGSQLDGNNLGAGAARAAQVC